MPVPPEDTLLTEHMLSSRASTQTHLLRDYALKQFKRDPQFEVGPPTLHSGSNFPQFFPEDLAMPEHIQPTIQRFLKHVFTLLPYEIQQNLSVLQRQDEYLNQIIKVVETGKKCKDFILIKGILCKIKTMPALKLQCCLPELFTKKFLRHLHQNMSFYHLEASKMQHIFQQTFFAKNITKLVHDCTKTCKTCILYLPYPHKKLLSGKKLIISRPREIIYADEVKILSTGPTSHFLTIVDGFSLFLSIYPLPHPASSEDIADCLVDYSTTHSAPYACCLDNAQNNQLNVSLALQILGIRKYSIPPFHPCSDLAERFQRVILTNLRYLKFDLKLQGKNLITGIKIAAFMWNSTKIKSLAWNTPFSVHYGTLPNDQLLIPKIHLGKTEVYPEYVKKLAKIQLGLFDRINDIKRAHETKRDTNNPPISPKLRVGDHVLIKNPIDHTKENPKLVQKYGSIIHRIIKISGSEQNQNYILLPLTEKNVFEYSFKKITPIPRQKLILAKINRLKPIRNTIYHNDSDLAKRLVRTMASLITENLEIQKDFEFNPSMAQLIVPENLALKKLFQKIIKDPPNADFYKEQITKKS